MAVAIPCAFTFDYSDLCKMKACEKLFLQAVVDSVIVRVRKVMGKKPSCEACEVDQPSQWAHCEPPSGCLYWSEPVKALSNLSCATIFQN